MSQQSTPLGRPRCRCDSRDQPSAEMSGLLSRDVIPTHYSVRLVPRYSDWTFTAQVAITLRVVVETDTLEFNGRLLDVGSAAVDTAAGETLRPTRINVDEEAHTITLRFDEPLRLGDATLRLDYSGQITNEMVGLYRSHYVHNGVQQTILVTQAEAVEARRFLPCWDEPAFKATFALTLVAPSDMQAHSNMPVMASRVLGAADDAGCAGRPDTVGWTEWQFDPTPLMSTYLLAFAVGHFESAQTATKSGTIVRALTPLGKIDQAQFGLDVGRRCLEFYEDYFDLPYPLPKLDLVAIPDVGVEAMENWGLITFAETALLVHPTSGSQSGRQYAALLIAHEIAHQWFGNIVTMRWWSQLWLNEGFASWAEYFCVDALFPDWKMWDQYLGVRFAFSLAADALEHSHALEVPMATPADIDENFDAVSYSKGSVAVRMMQQALGPEEFRRAISAYLKRFAYSNAVTADLWAAAAESSGKDVAGMMAKWANQTGYPIVRVKSIERSAGAGGDGAAGAGGVKLQLEQRRWLLQGPQEKEETTWSLPVALVAAGSGSSSAPTPAQLLTGRDATLHFDLPASATEGDDASSSSSSSTGAPAASSASSSASAPVAFKLNPGQVYLYRVLYPADHYPLLLRSLFSFSVSDRLGLQSDLFALWRSGALPGGFGQLVQFVESFAAAETELTVWAELTAHLTELGALLKNSGDGYVKFADWLSRLYAAALRRLGGWDARPGEHHSAPILRGRIVAALVHWGHEETIRECCRRFHAFIVGEAAATAAEGSQLAQLNASAAAPPASNLDADALAASPTSSSSLLAPDLRDGVYAAVVGFGGALGVEMMRARYESQRTSGGAREEQVRCLHALGCIRDRADLARTLEWALDCRAEVRTEDCSGLIVRAALNPVGTAEAWAFLRRRWGDVVRTFEGAFCLAKIVGLGAQMSSDAAADEFAAFMKKNKAPSAERAVMQTIERIRANAKCLAREEKNIAKVVAARLTQMKIEQQQQQQ